MRTLTTARLSLRPWAPGFENDLFRLSSDERVMRFIGEGRTWSRERNAERHRECLRHWQDHDFGWRAMIDGADFVGVAALNHLGDLVPGIEASAIEIGWWVDPRCWGRGFATEAARALRDEAFADVSAGRLVARYHPENLASGRVMVKLGMRAWGDIPGKGDRPVRVYTLDRTDWEALDDRTPGV
jgi:RimJ/RimL family protein N-acetyltransferase